MSKNIKRSTLEKLLKISETHDASIIEKHAREEFGGLFHELVENNILTHFKILKSVGVYDGDCEFIAEIQRRDGKNMYFSPADGWVAVSDEQINLYKIRFEGLLKIISKALHIDDRHDPKEILEDNIWALGQHRIEKRMTNIIVARKLRKESTYSALVNHLNNHHDARNTALIIILDRSIPDYITLPNQNELIRIDEATKWEKDIFEFNTILLAARMGGTASKPGFSNGYRSLMSNGVSYKFSKKQAEALEYLDKKNDTPIHQDEVLAEIDSSQSKLLQVFRSKGKKHPAWGEIIKGDGNGHYWLEY